MSSSEFVDFHREAFPPKPRRVGENPLGIDMLVLVADHQVEWFRAEVTLQRGTTHVLRE